jgi:hypothetical protein
MPSLLVFLLAGTLIGLIVRHLALRGEEDGVPACIPIAGGIGGLLLGWAAYAVFGGDGSDPGRALLAGLVAVSLAAVSSLVQRRRPTVYRYVGRPEDLNGPLT